MAAPMKITSVLRSKIFPNKLGPIMQRIRIYPSRNYAKRMNRRVIAVLTPQEEEELRKQPQKRHVKPIEQPREWKDLHPRERKAFTSPEKTATHNKEKPKEFQKFSKSDVAPPVIGKTGSGGVINSDKMREKPFKYEMLKELDPRFGYIMQYTKTTYGRNKHGIILVQGQELILKALEAGFLPNNIFFCGDSKIMVKIQEKVDSLNLSSKKKPNMYGVRKQAMQLWCNTDETPYVVGIFDMPPPEKVAVNRDDVSPFTLICDVVRSPASMVTILKGAAAAKVEKVLFAKGSVDIWDLEVVQAAGGCQFEVPIIQGVTSSSLLSYLDDDTTVHVIDCTDQTTTEVHPKKRKLLANLMIKSGNEDGTFEQTKIMDEKDLGKYAQLSFGTKEYSKVNFTNGKTAVVIVNSKENLQCINNKGFLNKLLFHYCGQKMYIPPSPDSDFTDIGSVTSILAAEMKRQLDRNSENGCENQRSQTSSI